MKISEKEEKILGAIQLDADLSIQSIRKLTGFRESTIHYCLNSLIDRNVIRRYVALDTAKLGYLEVAIACSLSFPENSDESWREGVVALSEVLFLWRIGGAYSYYLGVLVRSPDELAALYEKLFKGARIISKKVSFRSHFRFYGRRYLKQRGNIDFIERGRSGKAIVLDDLDHKLLTLLGKGGELTKTSIARRLGIPLTTLSYRIKRLIRENVVVGEIYSDAGASGSLIYIAYLSSSLPGPSLEEELHALCLQELRITSMGSWVGHWDYLLMLDVADLTMLGELLDRLKMTLGRRIVSLEEVPVFVKYKNNSFLS